VIRNLVAGRLAPIVVLLAAGSGSALAAPRSQPGKMAEGSFTPGRAASADFGSVPPLECPSSNLRSALVVQVERKALAAGVQVASMSGELCAVADTFLEWPSLVSPGENVAEFASRWVGMAGPAAQVLLAVLPTDSAVDISENLADSIVAFSKSTLSPRYGATSVLLPRQGKYDPPETRVLLALADEPITVSPPLPRRLALGQAATFSGAVNGRASDPRVVVSLVTGRVLTPDQAPGKAFKAEVRCEERPGLILIQVSGVVDGKRVALANFPVACGTDLPTSVPLVAAKAPADKPGLERLVLEMVNAERTHAGLPSLAWNDDVGSAARGVAEALGDEARSATATSPAELTSGMQKAGVASALVFVNFAAGPTIEAAQQRLVTSPSHRAHMLNPDVNALGVGASTATAKDGKSNTHIAEIFIRLAASVDTSQIREKLVSAIAQRRAEGKVPPMPVDADLQKVAQKYAAEMAVAQGPLSEKRDDEMIDGVRKRFRGVNLLTGATASPLDYTKQPKLLEKGDALGVGVVQGDHPTLGKNTFYVVIVYGTRR
jgi:uncharacterized protein YkwD